MGFVTRPERHPVWRFLIILAGVVMLSGCVVAPGGGYGYGYRVHPIIHPAWRGWGWRR